MARKLILVVFALLHCRLDSLVCSQLGREQNGRDSNAGRRTRNCYAQKVLHENIGGSSGFTRWYFGPRKSS